MDSARLAVILCGCYSGGVLLDSTQLHILSARFDPTYRNSTCTDDPSSLPYEER
jgi:hypothetical protein